MTVHVAAEIQKGQTAQYRLLYVYFPATRQAMRHYLRQHPGGPEDPLFRSIQNRRLSPGAAQGEVKALTEKLGIRSFNGKACSPHLFRHTFATLNIRPLGLKLDLEEIVSRLRHQDRNLAHRVYIANTPYIEQIKMTARVQEFRAQPRAPQTGVTGQDARGFVGPVSTPAKPTPPAVAASEAGNPSSETFLLREADAVAHLAQLRVKAPALRKHCLAKGMARRVLGALRYSENYVLSLKTGYMLLRTARLETGFSVPTFYNNAASFGLVSIGKAVLVNRATVDAYQDRRRKRDPAA